MTRGDEAVSPYDRIDELETQLSAAQEKIVDLENDLERLKNFIRLANTSGPNNDKDFQGWEIFALLRNWAQE